jgi:hypothetical protein
MTDNFDTIRKYLITVRGIPELAKHAGDDHVVIELIRRGKDNPDMPGANYHFKNYYIDSIEKFDKFKAEIITLCDVMRLRAYISVNKKSFKQVLKDMVAEGARRIAGNDYNKPYAIYESCSGKNNAEIGDKFIVDVDDGLKSADEYLKLIMQCRPFSVNSKTRDNYYINKTRTGCHIVIGSFDQMTFKKLVQETYGAEFIPDIKKNHLTLLYENL